MYCNGASLSHFAFFRSGRYTDAVIAADLNGDGKPDLVAANFGDGTLSVFAGNGDGTFQPRQALEVDNGPASVFAADVNLDGRLDLVVANSGLAVGDRSSAAGNTVSVLLGNGDGTFQPKVDFAVGASPQSVIVADVNSDNLPDIITANRAGGTVSILFNQGGGSFGGRSDIAAGASPISVASGDFNADGHTDLIVANSRGFTVTALFGDGTGRFAAPGTYITGVGPRSVSVGDVTGDGVPDVITANYLVNSITVLPGLVGGGFGARLTYLAGPVAFATVIADMDGDGRNDIITANEFNNAVGVLSQNFGNKFQFPLEFPTGGGPVAIATADFNGDGRPDIATAGFATGTVAVLLNTIKATTLTLVSGQPTAAVGTIVPFTAKVTASNGGARGYVAFFRDSVFLGFRPVRIDGTAVLYTRQLTAGDHTYRAEFISNRIFGSSSASIAQTVSTRAATPTFTASIAAQEGVFPMTRIAGRHETLTITLKGNAAELTYGEAATQSVFSTWTAVLHGNLSLSTFSANNSFDWRPQPLAFWKSRLTLGRC